MRLILVILGVGLTATAFALLGGDAHSGATEPQRETVATELAPLASQGMVDHSSQRRCLSGTTEVSAHGAQGAADAANDSSAFSESKAMLCSLKTENAVLRERIKELESLVRNLMNELSLAQLNPEGTPLGALVRTPEYQNLSEEEQRSVRAAVKDYPIILTGPEIVWLAENHTTVPEADVIRFLGPARLRREIPEWFLKSFTKDLLNEEDFALIMGTLQQAE